MHYLRLCLTQALASHGLRVQILLEHDAQLFPHGLQLVEVLVVLALVLYLGLDALCVAICQYSSYCSSMCVSSPSNILTAVGKSFTLLAARSAAVMTEGEGTRS